MAEDYIYQQAVPASRFGKVLKVLIVIAALFLAGELIWLLGISPARPFSRIDITGYEGIGRAEILSRAGIAGNSSFFSVDIQSAEAALMAINNIESAIVTRRFPDRLHISLEPRRPVAIILLNHDGNVVPALLDGNAVIYQIGPCESGDVFPQQLASRLPVVSGLIIESPYPGMRLPPLFIPFFTELERINSSAPELLGAVSELRINRRTFDSYDILLFPVHTRIRVRLSELSEEILRYSLLMLDVLASREGEINTLDFRSGIASYIPEGGAL
jgi:cell division protein FtsQ